MTRNSGTSVALFAAVASAGTVAPIPAWVFIGYGDYIFTLGPSGLTGPTLTDRRQVCQRTTKLLDSVVTRCAATGRGDESGRLPERMKAVSRSDAASVLEQQECDELLEQPGPGAAVAPPAEPPMRVLPVAVAGRKIAPGCPRPQGPEDSVEKTAIVVRDAAPLPALPWKMRLQKPPSSIE